MFKAAANVIVLYKATNFLIKKSHLFYKHFRKALIIKDQGFDEFTGIISPLDKRAPFEMKSIIYFAI